MGLLVVADFNRLSQLFNTWFDIESLIVTIGVSWQFLGELSRVGCPGNARYQRDHVHTTGTYFTHAQRRLSRPPFTLQCVAVS